jgi:hypothetical protein
MAPDMVSVDPPDLCRPELGATILEIPIRKRVLTFLNKHNMISKAQNDFREKKSTNTATQKNL